MVDRVTRRDIDPGPDYRRLQGRSAHALAARLAKLVETFDEVGTSFVSITQSFNTTTSIGGLTLNMLLSFARLSSFPADAA